MKESTREMKRNTNIYEIREFWLKCNVKKATKASSKNDDGLMSSRGQLYTV